MRVFDNAFTDFKGKVQAGKIGIALFKLLHDAQSVQVVIKQVTVLAHGGVQNALAGVTKRRMSHVMHQGQRFYQIFIQPKFRRNGAGDLGNLNRMGQAVAEVIRMPAGKNLRLVLQAAESPRVDHAIAVTLEIAAVGMAGLRVAPSAAIFRAQRIRG